jgi:hypothetical protein
MTKLNKIKKNTELDDLILQAHSKKLIHVKINQLEKKIIVISVKGKDYIDDYNEALQKIKNFANHLNESNNLVNDLIQGA